MSEIEDIHWSYHTCITCFGTGNNPLFRSLQSLSHVRLFATPWITARQAAPSPTLGVHSNSCPSSQWCHPAISSSIIPFSYCPQSLPPSGSFPMSQLFIWGSQSIGVSASASVLPMNTQDWSPLGWIPCSPRDSQESSPIPQFKCINSSRSAFFTVQPSHPYMTIGKTITLTRWTFVGKVMSLLFNMLSRLVITFLPRSKRLLISWLQSPSAVILEPQKIKSDTVSTASPSISHEVMGKKIPHAATKDPHLEPACQCRGHGFDPRPRKIAHVEQLSPRTPAEPVCCD